MKKSQKKVLIALSGGIDSAVSAYLLIRQGYKVEAAFMKNWSSTAGLLKNDCPWLQDRQDALRVAAFLKIPLRTLDFERQYGDTVMKYFFSEYRAGRTPNPDVMCNKEIKFKLLYNWAVKNGFDFLATGHYAQIKHGQLLRSGDEFKDQTYFIYNIKTEQLPRLMFPVGGMKKSAVKKTARNIGLPNRDKKESMGLCFVGKIRLKDFLKQKLKPKKGRILDQDGRKIGEHEGLFNYTLGQRQGIAVGGSGPYYVIKKDLTTNTLYVTNNVNDKRLAVLQVDLRSLNWIAFEPQKINRLAGRYRHQGELMPLTVTMMRKGLCQVKFRQPQKAVASGQSLVLYKGKQCVGGGIIV